MAALWLTNYRYWFLTHIIMSSIPNERQMSAYGETEKAPETQQGALEPLGATPCSAFLFQLFASDLIIRLIEKLPESSFKSWVEPHDNETRFSFHIAYADEYGDGRTHMSSELPRIIDSICERYASILLELYPEPQSSEIRQFRVAPLLGKEFHAASKWVSRWIHSSGITILSQDSTSGVNP